MTIRPPRALLLVPGGLSLLAGLDAALLLLGVRAPVTSDRLGDLHGMVLVVGFLGTLIALERAVALRHPLAHLGPALLGAGAVALLSPAPEELGKLLFVEGAVALTAVTLVLHRRNHDETILVQALGAGLLTGATALWVVGVGVPALLPWLAGFVVLTIAAERVELARLTMPGTGERTLVLHAIALVLGVVAATLWPSPGSRLLGLVLGSLVLWLARHDVARRLIRAQGLPRFSAAGLLAGYLWLLVVAATWIVVGAPRSIAAYDAVAHGVMLGFAMSMVIAHAPVILPSVLRRPLPYRRYLWLPLTLLHAGLLIRVVAGDLAGHRVLWQVGGVVGVAALLAFVACTVIAVVTASRADGRVRTAGVGIRRQLHRNRSGGVVAHASLEPGPQ